MALDMKLVGADIGFGGEKITFSFYSEERVDFRDLVADLAKALKMRIELRQVGAREEARMVGGLGPCGRGLCCSPVPGRRRAGLHPHGQGAEPAPQPDEDLRPVRPADVLPQVRAGAVRALPQRGASQRHQLSTKVVTLSYRRRVIGVVAGYNFTKEAKAERLEDGTTTEVRLSSCETQENVGPRDLVVIPEAPVEELSPMGWLDSRFGNFDRLVEDRTEDLPVVEAEVILNEKGEPIEVSVTESTRKRGRRGRGRRRGAEEAAKPPGMVSRRRALQAQAENLAPMPEHAKAAGLVAVSVVRVRIRAAGKVAVRGRVAAAGAAPLAQVPEHQVEKVARAARQRERAIADGGPQVRASAKVRAPMVAPVAGPPKAAASGQAGPPVQPGKANRPAPAQQPDAGGADRAGRVAARVAKAVRAAEAALPAERSS